MRRTFLIGLLATLSLNAAYATGSYFGGTLGLKSTFDHQTGSITDSSFGIHSRKDFGWLGGTGDFYLGYLLDFRNRFLLGIEGNAEFNSAVMDENLAITTEKSSLISLVSQEISAKNSYGLSLLPGLNLNRDLLVYLRLGAVYGELHDKIVSIFSQSNRTFHRLGVQVGMGAEYKFMPHLSLRTDCVYQAYPSFTQRLPINFEGSSLPFSVTNSIRSTAFNVGLTYSFC